MQISARNQIPGRVTSVRHGAVNASVKIEIGEGVTVTSSITGEAVAELDLLPGDAVTVIIKASDVMIGK